MNRYNGAIFRDALSGVRAHEGIWYSAVQVNAINHREAIETLSPSFNTWANNYNNANSDRSLRFSDIACGRELLTPSALLESVRKNSPQIKFDFHGTDLEPDQVEIAKTYPLPSNVTKPARFNVGDAWADTFDALSIFKPTDAILSSLHLHHGTTKQMQEFARKVFDSLNNGGVWMGHVELMPEGLPYLPRPNDDGKEILNWGKEFKVIDRNQDDWPSVHGDWREAYNRAYMTYLEEHDVGKDIQDAITSHNMDSDYCLSLEMLKALLKFTGFDIQLATRFGDNPEIAINHRVSPWFGAFMAIKP
ncbi:hypothetical protein BVY03_01145 [bacterium K02(2017)]|nr:hypothetical protein BVY03_01145 [bacterium K02(2017)]